MRAAAAFLIAAMLAGCDRAGDDGNGAAAATGTADSAAGAMQPGQWEGRAEMVDANTQQPAAAAGSQPASRLCLTAEQAANPAANPFASNLQAPGCRTENSSFADGRIQGTANCQTSGGRARVTFSGRYSPTSYEMTARVEAEGDGAAVSQTMRVTARRIGDCPPGSEPVVLQPGQWEVTAAVGLEDRNRSDRDGPMAGTERTCLSPARAANGLASLVGVNVGAPGCTTEGFSVAGGRIQGSLVCRQQGFNMRQTVNGRYSATSLDVTTQTQYAEGTPSEARTTARRIGDCPAG